MSFFYVHKLLFTYLSYKRDAKNIGKTHTLAEYALTHKPTRGVVSRRGLFRGKLYMFGASYFPGSPFQFGKLHYMGARIYTACRSFSGVPYLSGSLSFFTMPILLLSCRVHFMVCPLNERVSVHSGYIHSYITKHPRMNVYI